MFSGCLRPAEIMSHNVLLMRSRGSLSAAIWRSPNDRQGVKRISFVIC